MADGLTSAGIKRIHEVAERHVGDTRVPGLAALVARGEDVHVEALGDLTIGGRPVARDSIFRIASTTKPITAAATLSVIEEGLIDIDEPIDPFLPELADRQVLHRMDGPLDETVPAYRPITTRDLMTFTFGFGMVMEMFMAQPPWPVVAAAEGELRLATIGPPDPAVQPDPDSWIANLGTLPLLAQPGERWLYNTGASVLGVLLARATGQPFAEVLQTRVFDPLGMKNTGFWTEHTDRLATAYRPTPEGLVVWDEPDGSWSRPPAFGDGAAGLLSTVDDLLAFARMLLGGGAPGALTRLRPGDDHRPADRRPEGERGPWAELLRRPVLVLLPGGARHRRLRLGRRPRHLLAGGSRPRPDDDRAQPATVREPRAAAGPHRYPSGGVRGARLRNGRRPRGSRVGQTLPGQGNG